MFLYFMIIKDYQINKNFLKFKKLYKELIKLYILYF